MNIKTGFTLIELLVVVLIIGVLAAIALPKYNMLVEKSRAAETRLILKAIHEANIRYFLETGAYTFNLNELDIDVPGTDVSSGTTVTKTWKKVRYKNAGNVTNNVFNDRVEAEKTSVGYRLTYRNDGLYCMGQTDQAAAVCKSMGKATLKNFQGDCNDHCWKID